MNHSQARTERSFFDNVNRAFTGLDDVLEKNVRDHLRNVYATVAIGVGLAAVGASVHLFTNILSANMFLPLISFGLMMALITTPHTPQNEKKRLAFFSAFCGLAGVSLGPLLERVIFIDPSIVFSAVMITAVVFACFTLAALHAPSTKYLYLGGTLLSATFALLLSAFFLPVAVVLWGGVALNCGFVLYDTQLICEKCRRGDNDYIWGALDLFLDILNMFRYITVLLADKKERDNRRRKD